jgi:hypothetical protein
VRCGPDSASANLSLPQARNQVSPRSRARCRQSAFQCRQSAFQCRSPTFRRRRLSLRRLFLPCRPRLRPRPRRTGRRPAGHSVPPIRRRGLRQPSHLAPRASALSPRRRVCTTPHTVVAGRGGDLPIDARQPPAARGQPAAGVHSPLQQLVALHRKQVRLAALAPSTAATARATLWARLENAYRCRFRYRIGASR